MALLKSFRDALRVSRAVVKLTWETSRKYTVYVVVLLTLSAFLPIIEAYLIKRAIDALTLSLSAAVAFTAILIPLLFFIVVTIIDQFVQNQRNTVQIVLGNLFQKHISQRMVEKTASVSFWKFEDPAFHDKLDRIRNQVSWKPLNTFYSLFGAVQNIILLFSIFVALYVLSPLFVLLMILFSMPTLYAQVKYGNDWWNIIFKETPKARKLNYLQALMTGRAEMKDLKLLNLQKYFLGKSRALYDELFEEQKTLLVRRYWVEFLTFLLSDVILMGFYIFLAWQTYMKKVTIGDFTFYSTLYTRGVSGLQSLMMNVASTYENNLFIDELIEFLNAKEEREETGTTPVPTPSQGFSFKNVWFKYPGTTNWVLKGVSFELPLKQSMALVGENGAGKTTIVKLLVRLYKPTKGQILLDGIPIDQLEIDSYRKLFGITFQDFAKFYFTAEDNITIGDINRDIPRAELISVAKRMQIHNKIMTLPKKYKNMLGRWFHEGYELSYGEWQRIAIARALIRHAPIYILDEPTAALDAKAEYQVFSEFRKHIKGKTGFFISHRFSNVKLADYILMLEEGKIVEQGTHPELLRKKGKYSRLYTFQAKRYQD